MCPRHGKTLLLLFTPVCSTLCNSWDWFCSDSLHVSLVTMLTKQNGMSVQSRVIHKAGQTHILKFIKEFKSVCLSIYHSSLVSIDYWQLFPKWSVGQVLIIFLWCGKVKKKEKNWPCLSFIYCKWNMHSATQLHLLNYIWYVFIFGIIHLLIWSSLLQGREYSFDAVMLL